MKRALIVLCVVAAAAVGQTIPAAVPLPNPEVQFVDAAGVPLAGAFVCSYQAGTSTPTATYTDSTASTPNSNPVVLDSAGRASIWVGPALVKIVVRTGATTCANGVVAWTQDNISNWLTGYTAIAGLSSRLTVSIPGTLAIGSDLGPSAFYTASTTVKSVTAIVKTAPTGASLVMQVQQGATVLFTCTIPAASTSCTASSGAQTVPANTRVVVNITAVGTTFPGADLTLQLN